MPNCEHLYDFSHSWWNDPDQEYVGIYVCARCGRTKKFVGEEGAVFFNENPQFSKSQESDVCICEHHWRDHNDLSGCVATGECSCPRYTWKELFDE